LLNTVPEESSADRPGWHADLRLKFEASDLRTFMHREHSGPLMVQRAFYPEGDVCHAVILHPPSGIVGGDVLNIQVQCHRGASALCTTPGATRFYGSDGRRASQTQTLDINGGSMEWLPQETIYFNEVQAHQKLVVNLAEHSRFIGWDINCFGRPAGGHYLEHGEAHVGVCINYDDTALLHEQLRIHGGSDLQRLSGLRGATVSATMIAVSNNISDEWLPLIRELLPDKNFAATLVDHALVIRYLGDHTQQVKGVFINVWQLLRPLINNRKACAPRIWAT